MTTQVRKPCVDLIGDFVHKTILESISLSLVSKIFIKIRLAQDSINVVHIKKGCLVIMASIKCCQNGLLWMIQYKMRTTILFFYYFE